MVIGPNRNAIASGHNSQNCHARLCRRQFAADGRRENATVDTDSVRRVVENPVKRQYPNGRSLHVVATVTLGPGPSAGAGGTAPGQARRRVATSESRKGIVMRQGSRRHGFTLIELLVVIAIIAVL